MKCKTQSYGKTGNDVEQLARGMPAAGAAQRRSGPPGATRWQRYVSLRSALWKVPEVRQHPGAGAVRG